MPCLEPAQETIYNWNPSVIPKTVKWIATDSDGEVYGYEYDTPPDRLIDKWDSLGVCYNLHYSVIKKEVPWTESLEKRPG